jgi:hypothetical protein
MYPFRNYYLWCFPHFFVVKTPSFFCKGVLILQINSILLLLNINIYILEFYHFQNLFQNLYLKL